MSQVLALAFSVDAIRVVPLGTVAPSIQATDLYRSPLMQYADVLANMALQNSLTGLFLMGLGLFGLLVMWLVSR